MKYLILRCISLLGIVMLGSCTAPIKNINASLENIATPISEKLLIAEVGSAVLIQGQRYKYDGIQLLEDVEASGLFGAKLRIPSQTLVAGAEDDKWIYFFGSKSMITIYDPVMGTHFVSGGLKISKPIADSSETEGFFLDNYGNFIGKNLGTYDPVTPPKYKIINMYKGGNGTSSMELIYLGKKCSVLKFLYRKIEPSPDVSDTTVPLELDLSSSSHFKFRGADLLIIDADDMKISYIVKSGFSQSNPVASE